MGLDCSHDAFSGAYSAFNRLRQVVCAATGPEGSFPPHYKRTPEGQIEMDRMDFPVRREDLDGGRFYVDNADGFTRETHPGLFEFLAHSDCEGEISLEMCVLVAKDLTELLPRVEALNWPAFGHLSEGHCAVLRKFIKSCLLAAKKKQPLEFR